MTKKPPRPKRTRSKTRTVRARTPNGYIYFYKIYSKILKNDNPQLLSWQIGRLTGQMWRENLSCYLKNEFIKYAKDEYKIRNFYSTVVPPSSTNIMNFDRSSEEELLELFEKYIQYPPNPPY
ncbi:hypothetical protein GLOIN_2v1659045 [Rhizophagus irregularis DAOM 181602=DAOM 197198]|uniref:HMG box domain-containing protein n=1 Tax=Rhizophagus irregularis (strain DAOM 181602 / DAOM 197198 / MUCL 43194) TaxID=747089 RepID=A0A2P4PLD0_RHIID|nr:hypothetical protein GLOIN_2v1659045 [Rhizophagus irregularis DAOM 181602=DAOM 197198]POG66189.1 hypothetical protein GLOIN_2v1659045 [Rhizophagus irregularis DAOM 181602=DAOM 197198]GET62596.1 hypothetical protein GLOIN_2v1659045 [Rhizophagus irregularis DAOM 181602=DAOM 197198]|eukprot:XP_025173055.1 hypothetical protein GLOIN_2v1659045 [Rhizophagus irregularis DAOM 181602=DAOM 197198]